MKQGEEKENVKTWLLFINVLRKLLSRPLCDVVGGMDALDYCKSSLLGGSHAAARANF